MHIFVILKGAEGHDKVTLNVPTHVRTIQALLIFLGTPKVWLLDACGEKWRPVYDDTALIQGRTYHATGEYNFKAFQSYLVEEEAWEGAVAC